MRSSYQIGIALFSQGVALFCKAGRLVWLSKTKEIKTFDNIDHNLKFKFKSKYDQAERVINFCDESKLC